MRNLVYALILALAPLSAMAQLDIEITGGTGGNPLTIQVVTGDSVTAIVSNPSVGTGFLILDNIFPSNGILEYDSTVTNTIFLNGAGTDASVANGVFSAGANATSNDLVISFSGVPAFSSGDSFTITTGIRVLDAVTALNLTTISTTGSYRIWNNAATTAFSTVGTYNVVPEPSTYAAMAGVAVLGLAIWRRRRA